LGDAALGEVVFFGELGLAEAMDLIVEIDLEITPGGGGEFARAGAVRFEGCSHGKLLFQRTKYEGVRTKDEGSRGQSFSPRITRMTRIKCRSHTEAQRRSDRVKHKGRKGHKD
jgi:hypothetical protein